MRLSFSFRTQNSQNTQKRTRYTCAYHSDGSEGVATRKFREFRVFRVRPKKILREKKQPSILFAHKIHKIHINARVILVLSHSDGSKFRARERESNKFELSLRAQPKLNNKIVNACIRVNPWISVGNNTYALMGTLRIVITSPTDGH